MLALVVIWKMWRWQFWSAALLISPFVIIDGTFLLASLMKVHEGAWVPVMFGG